MNCSHEVSSHKPRANCVTDLITTGLGYCCEAFFWERFKEIPSDLIAARLGIAVRTVNRHRQWYAEGKFSCEGKLTCIINRWRNKCQKPTQP